MKTFEQQRVEQLEEALLRERNALEAVREERNAARNALKEANAALYAVGAPLGSENYFKIRGILTADTNASPLRDYGQKSYAGVKVWIGERSNAQVISKELFDSSCVDELFLGFQAARDIVNRLNGYYAQGPISANGLPEFGWRDVRESEFYEGDKPASRVTEQDAREAMELLGAVADEDVGMMVMGESWHQRYSELLSKLNAEGASE